MGSSSYLKQGTIHSHTPEQSPNTQNSNPGGAPPVLLPLHTKSQNTTPINAMGGRKEIAGNGGFSTTKNRHMLKGLNSPSPKMDQK